MVDVQREALTHVPVDMFVERETDLILVNKTLGPKQLEKKSIGA